MPGPVRNLDRVPAILPRQVGIIYDNGLVLPVANILGFSLSVAKSLAALQDGKLSLSNDGTTGMSVTITFPPERVLADSEDPLPVSRPLVSRTGE